MTLCSGAYCEEGQLHFITLSKQDSLTKINRVPQ